MAQEELKEVGIDFEQELYKAFGQIKDFTLGVVIAKRFYDMGRKYNEPVSEDLEEAAKAHSMLKRSDDTEVGYDLNRYGGFIAGAEWQKNQFEKNRLKHCKSITNEQAELEQCFIDQHLDKHQRMPTFLDAIEYGMRLKEKQIMENATEATVAVDAGGYPYIPQLELYDYDKDVPLAKEGDKYKVVLIKED